MTLFDPILQCTMCNDITQFNSAKDDARRILQCLLQLKEGFEDKKRYELSDEDELEKKYIQYQTYLSFMCGSCYKANQEELWNIEEQIRDLVYQLYKTAINTNISIEEKDNIIYTLQYLVQGFYPSLEHFLSK